MTPGKSKTPDFEGKVGSLRIPSQQALTADPSICTESQAGSLFFEELNKPYCTYPHVSRKE